jgi:hypothetical protein
MKCFILLAGYGEMPTWDALTPKGSCPLMTSTSDRSSTSAERVIADMFRSDWGRLRRYAVSGSRRL